jgi:hypothetical protein
VTHNLCLQNLCTLKFRCWYWWLRSLRCGCTTTHLLGLQVRIQSEAWMRISYECCVLSGRVSVMNQSLIHWIPTECVCYWVWSWSLNSEEALAYWGCQALKNSFSLWLIISQTYILLFLWLRDCCHCLYPWLNVVMPVGMWRSLSSNDLWWWKQWDQ